MAGTYPAFETISAMGHTRLGPIPKTRPWNSVVAAFAGVAAGGAPGRTGSAEITEVGASRVAPFDRERVAGVADKALQAARGGLERAKEDPGLLYSVYLLTQVTLQSREANWHQRLERLGLNLGPNASLLDLTAEFQGAVDDWLARRRHQSDVSEMAARAATDALAALAAPKARTLFGDTGEELRLAVRPLSTKAGFADLGNEFFGRFIAGFLNFYLSRVTATHLGDGRLHQVGDITTFNRLLDTHCRESAKIVRDFAGQWYSKTEYEQGITLENTGGFVAFALSKLQEELRFQREVGTPPAGDQSLSGNA